MVQFPPLCNRPQRHSRNRILRDGLAAVPRTILPGPNTGTWGTPFHAAMNRAGPGPPADLVFFLPVHLGQPRVASGPRRTPPLRAHGFLAEPIRQASTKDNPEEGSVVSPRRGDNRRRSRCPASYAL